MSIACWVHHTAAQVGGYESLNVNLRLVPLTEVSMSNSDA
jgi:hypothetical protein